MSLNRTLKNFYTMAVPKEVTEFVDVLLSETTVEQKIEFYRNCVKNYDELCEKALYRYPQIMAQEFNTFKLPLHSKIVDVGAGTGRLGKLLHSLGYTNIDALDGCEEMLNCTRKLTNVYKSNIHALVVEDKKLPIPENTYDVALMVGSASANHINVNAYKQVIRVVKPGGIVGWITQDANTLSKYSSKYRNNNYYTNELEKFVDEYLWVPVDGYNPKIVPKATLNQLTGCIYFYNVL